MEVKLLNYTNMQTLEDAIEKWYGYGYKLAGSVTVGINGNGNTIFVATMIKGVGE
ncbi:hypothetical protein [Salmonella phage SSBI34]|nr:hypothetical protein [Salmonella phage SSBI34]